VQERLYATYFAGDATSTPPLPEDTEARDIWRRFLPPERILPFDKKVRPRATHGWARGWTLGGC